MEMQIVKKKKKRTFNKKSRVTTNGKHWMIEMETEFKRIR